jgi:hypothetical protein
MNIKNDLYSFLLKSIREIEISIILLLDEGSSDSLSRDNVISCFFNFFKVIVGGSMPIRKYDRGSRFSCKTQSQ